MFSNAKNPSLNLHFILNKKLRGIRLNFTPIRNLTGRCRLKFTPIRQFDFPDCPTLPISEVWIPLLKKKILQKCIKKIRFFFNSNFRKTPNAFDWALPYYYRVIESIFLYHISNRWHRYMAIASEKKDSSKIYVFLICEYSFFRTFFQTKLFSKYFFF